MACGSGVMTCRPTVLIAAAWATNHYNKMEWHVWIGYSILTLLIFRIIRSLSATGVVPVVYPTAIVLPELKALISLYVSRGGIPLAEVVGR